MFTVIGGDGMGQQPQPQDDQEAAVWRAIDIGSTPAARAAVRRLRAAARRAGRDPNDREEFRLLAAAAALHPWMLQEAEDLLRDWNIDAPRVLEALEAFIAVHRRPHLA
jgi:hypothetical protein